VTVDHEFLSFRDSGRYPIDAGTLVSSGGLAFPETEYLIDLDDHALAHLRERAIRNYDPCISCSAHFLDLTVTRT
jgi:hypothetical protein